MTYRTVTVEAVLIPSVVAANAVLSDRIVPVQASVSTPVQYTQYPEYEGEIEFIPSAEAQTIHIKNTVAHTDIIIDPIPSNYGLITQVGAGIRVS